MDNIFDRAQDLLDKAHERVAGATSQAAWLTNQSLVIRQLEALQTSAQAELDRSLRELGEYTYQAWRSGANDPRIDGLCRHIEDLKRQYEGAGADLAAARTATYNPTVPNAWQGQPRGQIAGSPLPLPTVTPIPNPALSQQQAAQPDAASGWAGAGTAGGRERRGTPAPASAGTGAPRQAEPQSGGARACPNCGHFVPGGVDYCPSCGFRVA